MYGHNGIQRERLRKIEKAYVQWIGKHIKLGMTPYLMTFQFNPLPGSARSQIDQMQKAVERTYAFLLTRIVRSPRSSCLNHADRPIWVCSPDRPVFKHDKISLQEASVNDGVHLHAIALIPKKSRLEDFEGFIDNNQEMLANPRRPLMRVHAKPITSTPDKATSYAVKGIFKERFSYDDLLILPRTLTELDNGRTAFASRTTTRC